MNTIFNFILVFISDDPNLEKCETVASPEELEQAWEALVYSSAWRKIAEVSLFSFPIVPSSFTLQPEPFLGFHEYNHHFSKSFKASVWMLLIPNKDSTACLNIHLLLLILIQVPRETPRPPRPRPPALLGKRWDVPKTAERQSISSRSRICPGTSKHTLPISLHLTRCWTTSAASFWCRRGAALQKSEFFPSFRRLNNKITFLCTSS